MHYSMCQLNLSKFKTDDDSRVQAWVTRTKADAAKLLMQKGGRIAGKYKPEESLNIVLRYLAHIYKTPRGSLDGNNKTEIFILNQRSYDLTTSLMLLLLGILFSASFHMFTPTYPTKFNEADYFITFGLVRSIFWIFFVSGKPEI